MCINILYVRLSKDCSKYIVKTKQKSRSKWYDVPYLHIFSPEKQCCLPHHLEQGFLNFFAPGTGFVEDNLSMDGGWRG